MYLFTSFSAHSEPHRQSNSVFISSRASSSPVVGGVALVLYHLKGPEFIPTNLFLDLLLMIKNAFFCVAKSKIDNPDGLFWIILLGTGRLEIVFGILRTMIGNDANMDMLQLVSRLSGCTEVANILAKYPPWDHSPRRLKVPAISRDSKELPDAADHINPASWKGNVEVKNVSLQTSWRRGRRLVESECPFTALILQSLEKDPDVNIFSPRGIFLINKPLGQDDVDESLIFPENTEPTSSSTRDSTADAWLEVENALGKAIGEEIQQRSQIVHHRGPYNHSQGEGNRQVQTAR